MKKKEQKIGYPHFVALTSKFRTNIFLVPKVYCENMLLDLPHIFVAVEDELNFKVIKYKL